MADTRLDVVPRPRHVESRERSVRFDVSFTIETSGADAEPARSLLESLLERETNAELVSTAEPNVHLSIEDSPSDAFDDPEGYALEAADGGVVIRSTSVQGLRHGCQTFVGGLALRDGRWEFPGCEIHDWPETSWRGLMLDPAWWSLPTERVKRRVDQAARAKMNRLRLRLLDDEGYALESETYPELNQDADGTERPAYSSEDVAELVEYAGRRGIEIVPEINVPSHAEHVIARFPELQCTLEDGDASERTVCIGCEETFEFVETLLDETIDMFPFDVVQVGGDDWAHHGYSWNECVDCRATMEADGSESVTDLFYAFVRHLHGFLEDRGKRTMLWNDQIDVSESPDLPRDALIQFWRVAAPGRGPIEGCSMERFLEEDFEVVNSYVYAAFARGWISEEYMQGWAPRRRPTVPEELESRVRGGELLALEPSNEERREYFERALPSAIPVFGDRLWNPEPIDGGPAFRRSLTRHALGPFVPEDFDVYRELGGTILPTNWKRSGQGPPAHANRSIADRSPERAKADYESAIETLASLRDAGETVYPETATAYLNSLDWLVDVAEREGRGVLDRS